MINLLQACHDVAVPGTVFLLDNGNACIYIVISLDIQIKGETETGTVLKARIVKIGNSRGIRIPKLLREQIGLGEDVSLEIQENQIVIRPARSRRQGWEEQFKAMAKQGDDRLLDAELVSHTSWDANEWEW